ncbi:hypothetical protein GCM10023093_12480 [Nemorincola caseinilytica]|uniref:J domain-containing protein n=1 Tax=Nemorincola caseinilytica TaxID=2054315 RepID=A0ABP8NCN0_9BACT
MQLKDHYKTLGVRPSAVQAEIKKAYRELAVRYHPDKNPGNEFCEAQFKEVAEAYGILADKDRRAKYDDERWLMGMGSKTSYEDAVTPEWLRKVCMELNSSLATMDTHRMSQRALQAYIMLILSDAHIGVLLRDGDKAVNGAIVSELLKATERLEIGYLGEVLHGLRLIAGSDAGMKGMIAANAADRQRQNRRQRMFPYVVIAVTLALCVFMYLYGGMS